MGISTFVQVLLGERMDDLWGDTGIVLLMAKILHYAP